MESRRRGGGRLGAAAAGAAAVVVLLCLVAAAAGAADPEPPGESFHQGGRTVWQLGEDGGLKLAGASPPVPPQRTPPKYWTFNTPCKAGVCSGLCWEKTRWYDSGRCYDSASGRRYCKCWRAAGGGEGGAAAVASS
ncbi:hypothetical protein Rsub_05645 [Raphidocelis subcapitata]|uniref:Uncharacterized protein n=1 Tax=Raphidocelis subcapitata TaxID=307507 RepID=A0A2V0NZI1_9CHLO|nr:hypothetical protein Rsub_05645 [Raphidocelis subcapitata]|eukprot:GBF93034.1 hypothetical protein Rsub_05645 [Raphidocelis subcapitata]